MIVDTVTAKNVVSDTSTNPVDSLSVQTRNDTVLYIDTISATTSSLVKADTVPLATPVSAQPMSPINQNDVVQESTFDQEEFEVDWTIKKVLLKTGTVYIGRIVAIQAGKDLVVRTNDKRKHTVALTDIISIKSAHIAKHGSIGIGYGIPYGIAGASADVALFEFSTLPVELDIRFYFPTSHGMPA